MWFFKFLSPNFFGYIQILHKINHEIGFERVHRVTWSWKTLEYDHLGAGSNEISRENFPHLSGPLKFFPY